MSKIVVTGAAGFIGTYVVGLLLEKGYEVIAITNSKEVYVKSDKLFVVQNDICEESFAVEVAKSVKSCLAVVHLAADIRVPGNEKTITVNCQGTYHVVELANLLQAKSFIYMSSIPVIGKPMNIPITEEHPVKPKTIYHTSKLMGECILDQVGHADMQKAVLRISSPIGKGMRNSVFLYRLLQCCFATQDIVLYGSGKRVQNYVDVRDIAEAVALAIEKKVEGNFLIGGESISNFSLAKKCVSYTKAPIEIRYANVEDAQENDCWEVLGKRAEELLGFTPQYTLDDTIEWIYRDFNVLV